VDYRALYVGPSAELLLPELNDFDYGEWQGLSHVAVKEKYKALYEHVELAR